MPYFDKYHKHQEQCFFIIKLFDRLTNTNNRFLRILSLNLCFHSTHVYIFELNCR